MDRSRSWAIRCALELQQHRRACWITLTYSDANLPPAGSVIRSHLSEYLKRLRSRVHPERFRFFGCGEYGERGGRPHYHAILFGIDKESRDIEPAWQDRGFVGRHTLTPGSIRYVAGYCAKKEGWHGEFQQRIDYETGEVLSRDPPFILMSRRPGIGGEARKHWRSWKDTAIMDGKQYPVPRYLHEAWKANADSELQEMVLAERWEKRRVKTREELDAAEANARAVLNLQAGSRKL